MVEHYQEPYAKGTWVGYRPEIKVLDCTVRDGGLINDHQFSEEFVRAVYQTCVAAGVDYMEIGYKNSPEIFPPEEYGPWKHCTEEYVRRIVGENDTSLKISVMADAEKCDYQKDILPRSESAIDMIRVATYIHQMPIALDMIQDAHEKGYEVCLNLMALTTVQDLALKEALAALARSPVNVIYLVDSFGTLYSEQVRDLALSFLSAVEGTGKQIGVHAHNNQQLAYANTVEALIVGANFLDATINGMGRGAGNCPIELLIGFLHNPKFRLRPVLQCIEEHVLPLLDEGMEWGYMIPYMITGMLNQHPRAAIKLRAGERKNNFVEFYDEVTEEE